MVAIKNFEMPKDCDSCPFICLRGSQKFIVVLHAKACIM